MAMTWDQFDGLVARLERDAHERPASYKLRVGLLAMLGYVYILFVLALLSVLAVGIFVLLVNRSSYGAGKIAFVLLGVAWLILRALWVRIPPPEGRRLTRSEVPALFDMIDEVRCHLQGPRVHHVLLTDDFNAAIVQLPRLGIFGWQTNYLIVGLPLMQALSPEQFRAVLAHEFGHLSGAHGRFESWVYQVRRTWVQLLERLEEKQQWGAFIFRIFFYWYAPFFNAYTFVLARAQEYEADRYAAKVTGPSTAADALVVASVGGIFVDELFWPNVYKTATHEATPPSLPFSAMRRAFREGLPAMQVQQWLARTLNTPSSSEDTHPSLASRLAELQQSARVVAPPAHSAADVLLDRAQDTLQAELDALWRESVIESWKERYEQSQEDWQRLDNLNIRAQHEQLDVESALERAQLTEELHDGMTAMPLYELLVHQVPDCTPALFALGRLQLAMNNECGIALIERAMELDADAILPGCNEIYSYLIAQGQQQRAETYYKRGMERAQLLEDAEIERADVAWYDNLLPHDLSAEKVDALAQQLASFPEIELAYLARKEVQHLPDQPLYVLGIVAYDSRRRDLSEQVQGALMQRLSEELADLPGLTNAYVVNKRHMLLDQLKRVSQAAIYQRTPVDSK